MKSIEEALDNKPVVQLNGYGFLVNPLTEQVPYTTADQLRSVCAELAKRIDTKATTILVTEEDRGAIYLAGVSLLTGLPFGMARWQPNGLANQITQSFAMEYAKGTLYLNGIKRSDKVTIVDDFVSTGGTLIALIRAIKKAGAKIVDVICIAEKINYHGCKRIEEETGIKVKTLLKIDVSGSKSKVVK